MAQFKSPDAWAQSLGIRPVDIVPKTSDRCYALWVNGKRSGESTTNMRWFSITAEDGEEHILNVSRVTAEAVKWQTDRGNLREGGILFKEAMTGHVIKDFKDDDGNTRWCICLPGGEECGKHTALNGSFGFQPRNLLSRTARSLKVCKYRQPNNVRSCILYIYKGTHTLLYNAEEEIL